MHIKDIIVTACAALALGAGIAGSNAAHSAEIVPIGLCAEYANAAGDFAELRLNDVDVSDVAEHIAVAYIDEVKPTLVNILVDIYQAQPPLTVEDAQRNTFLECFQQGRESKNG